MADPLRSPEPPRPSRASRPRIGMALYGDLTHDSRVRREAASLAEAGYEIEIACLAGAAGPDLPRGVTVRVVRPGIRSVLPGTPSPFLALAVEGERSSPARGATGPVALRVIAGRSRTLERRARWLTGYVRALRDWGTRAVAAVGPVDAWHAHDLTGLAGIARRIGATVPLVYDAHELFLETGTALRLPWAGRRFLASYERRLVARTSAVVTVNEALAGVLSRRYRPRHIVAVHNCPEPWDPPPARPDLLREQTGIPAGSPVLLYHGALSIDRGVEELMEAIRLPGLERAHLVLLGFGEMAESYRRASDDPRLGGRVHVLDPVAPADLLPYVASADLGVMPIQPSTLNHRLSTPNKLFECLATGVPVVASDFPATRRIVLEGTEGPLGEVCDPTRSEAVAAAIRTMLDRDAATIEAYRSRCRLAAETRWNWQTQVRGLVDIYRDIIPDPGPPPTDVTTASEPPVRP